MEINTQRPDDVNNAVSTDVSTEQEKKDYLQEKKDYLGDEIDLINVIKNMKATRKYIWLIVAFFLLGVGIAGVITYLSPRKATITSMIIYNFEEPDKVAEAENVVLVQKKIMSADDVNYDIISSPYILSKALEKTDIRPLAKSKLTSSDISEVLTVNRVFSDATLQKISNLNLINDQNRLLGSDLANFNFEYTNQLVITLGGTLGLSQREATALLNNIVSAYNEYLFTEYSSMDIPTNYLANIDIANLEYSDAVDNIEMQLEVLKEFCDTNIYYGDYRLSTNGRSLTDAAKLIEFVQNEDLVYLKSFIHENGVTNNTERALALFEYQLMNLQYDYNELQENIESNRRLIENYKNDVNTVLNSGTQVEAGISVTDYYNSLIARQQENYEKKAVLISEIQRVEDLIGKVGNSNVQISASNHEYVTNEIAAIYKKTTELYDMIYDLVEEIIYSNRNNSSFIIVIPAQYNKLPFINSGTIKKIITFGLAGAFLAAVIWVVKAFLVELSRNKQSK